MKTAEDAGDAEEGQGQLRQEEGRRGGRINKKNGRRGKKKEKEK
jgi:hypothetical protein